MIERGIFIHKLERQADGRWGIIFTDEDGQIKMMPNAGECCTAILRMFDGDAFIEINFETVNGEKLIKVVSK